jgi:sec-independent protein translocase protein TatA
MPNIGPLEIIIVLVIVLIIFGPKRLPDLGRSLGRGMREFKDSVTGKDKDDDRPEIARAGGDAPSGTEPSEKQPTAAKASDAS